MNPDSRETLSSPRPRRAYPQILLSELLGPEQAKTPINDTTLRITFNDSSICHQLSDLKLPDGFWDVLGY